MFCCNCPSAPSSTPASCFKPCVSCNDALLPCTLHVTFGNPVGATCPGVTGQTFPIVWQPEDLTNPQTGLRIGIPTWRCFLPIVGPPWPVQFAFACISPTVMGFFIVCPANCFGACPEWYTVAAITTYTCSPLNVSKAAVYPHTCTTTNCNVTGWDNITVTL
jgi:hypothetical protein